MLSRIHFLSDKHPCYQATLGYFTQKSFKYYYAQGGVMLFQKFFKCFFN